MSDQNSRFEQIESKPFPQDVMEAIKKRLYLVDSSIELMQKNPQLAEQLPAMTVNDLDLQNQADSKNGISVQADYIKLARAHVENATEGIEPVDINDDSYLEAA